MSWRSSALSNERNLVCCLLIGAALVLAAPARAGVITASPVAFVAAEASPFAGTVATFTDSDPSLGASSFTATINWGDATTSAGTVTVSSGAFAVNGQHTYADEGTFSVTVNIAEVGPGMGTGSTTSTGSVSESDALSGSPTAFSAASGTSFTGTVAAFSDTDTTTPASDFNASINWGDATTSAGTVSGGAGTFQVNGTHTYAGSGNFSVTVTLSDDPPGTATAQVTSTAKVGTGNSLAAAPVNFSAGEGAPFNGPVATFTDSDITRTAASFTASIAWGDGTTSAGTVSGAAGSFTVSGQHIYPDEGTFTATVSIAEQPGTASASVTDTATVGETDVLSGTPAAITPFQGIPFTGTVATFTDANTANTAADFTASIDWGDGTVTPGVVSGSNGSFSVSGTHTYAATGNFTVVVTLTDAAP
nr:hypothetical protein [Acidobacteriota bacterium]